MNNNNEERSMLKEFLSLNQKMSTEVILIKHAAGEVPQLRTNTQSSFRTKPTSCQVKGLFLMDRVNCTNTGCERTITVIEVPDHESFDFDLLPDDHVVVRSGSDQEDHICDVCLSEVLIKEHF